MEHFILLRISGQTFKDFLQCISESFHTEFGNFLAKGLTAFTLYSYQLFASAGIDPAAETDGALQLGGTTLILRSRRRCHIRSCTLYVCNILSPPQHCTNEEPSFGFLCHTLSKKFIANLTFSSWFPFTSFVLGSQRKLLHGHTAL